MVDATDDACNVEITVELVSNLVAQQFPHWSQRMVTAVEPGGWDNRSFRLGDDVLVRLPSHARYVAQVDKEQRWLPILARELPLPVPMPIAKGAPGAGYPWPWSVVRWLDGEPANTESIRNEAEFARSHGFCRRSIASIRRKVRELEPTISSGEVQSPPTTQKSVMR